MAKIHNDALSREVDEALHIERVGGVLTLLNSKSEWNSGKLSRLTVQKSDWKLKKAMVEEEMLQGSHMKKVVEFKNSLKLPSFDNAIIKLTQRNQLCKKSSDIRSFHEIRQQTSASDA